MTTRSSTPTWDLERAVPCPPARWHRSRSRRSSGRGCLPLGHWAAAGDDAASFARSRRGEPPESFDERNCLAPRGDAEGPENTLASWLYRPLAYTALHEVFTSTPGGVG